MPIPNTLLHVEDEFSIRLLTSKILTAGGVRVTSCATMEEAELLGGEFEVALLDNHLPDGLGIHYGGELRARHPGMTLVLCTAEPGVRPPHGVFDGYLAKPFHLDQLFVVLSDAMERRQREHERQNLQTRLTQLRGRMAM